MANERQIVFTLKTTVEGEEVTPGTISLAHFNRFNRKASSYDQAELDAFIEAGSRA